MHVDGDGATPEFQRNEHKIAVLEEMVANLRAANDELEQKYFETTRRTKKLAYDFGFDSIDSAESAVARNPKLYDRATNEYNAKQLAVLEGDLKMQRELRKGDLETVRRLENELENLGQELESTKALIASASPPSGLTSEEATRTWAELKDLQARYDLLLQERDRFADKFHCARAKYDRFGDWIRDYAMDYTGDDPATKRLLGNMCIRLNIDLNKAPDALSQMKEEPSSPSDMPMSPLTPKKLRTPKKPCTKPFPAPSPLSSNIVNTHSPSTSSRVSDSPRSTPSKRKYDEAHQPTSPVGEETQTQIDSQAPSIYLPHMSIHFTPKKRPRRHSDSTMVPPSFFADITVPGPSTTSKKPKRPRYTEPVDYKARREGLENEANDEPSQYEINPEANHGLNFQFDEVVRKKQHRHALGAGDCEDCRDYYDAIGPMPSRLQPPAWRSPRKSPTHHHHANNTSVDAHKQEISRHRAQWRRPPTPPGYWDIGFPDTQEASKINARAAEMHREKQEMVRQEAQKEGGKFRRKG